MWLWLGWVRLDWVRLGFVVKVVVMIELGLVR